MFAITESVAKINGRNVDTFNREISNGRTALEVEAGTNGYQGGDSGHGSRTYLRIKDLGSTDIRCNVETDQFGCDSIEIILGGDAELETIKEALRWMLSVLETQSEMEG